MAYDESLAARIRKKFTRRQGAAEKEMFGGIGFLLHGNVCVGVWKRQLIVRVGGDEGHLALLEPHVHPFDITGKAMKGWLLIDPAGVADDRGLNGWIDRAIEFVATLPAKKKQKKTTTKQKKK